MGIEKIGLPARPSAKGRTWVLDASSCQTCQNPFTLFNRKHHCRRCGGLFCGTCSNARVLLRGQGDTPQRVCEPCKKLEEAARFQLRNRGKASKGISLGSSVVEDDALLKELGGDGLQSHLSGGSELIDGEDDDGHHGQTPKVSPSKDKSVEVKEESPGKLREQALEQKKLYSTLKREGKSAEALHAFKRHKELSREADAIELLLKKQAISQRKASVEASVQKVSKDSPDSAKDVGQQGTDDRDVSNSLASGRRGSKDNLEKASKDGGDDDLLKALKDLGWNEADLSEKKVKKGATSDMDLLAEIRDSLPEERGATKPVKQNPTQLEILAHKRQALALKRQGKPAEAKEELKKAKLLEKKLEENALLGDEEEEEDDDELAVLMRSLDKEALTGKPKDWSLPPTGGNVPLPFSLNDDDDDDNETNVDVTDDDINDPSMVAALKRWDGRKRLQLWGQSRAPESAGPDAFNIAESITKQSNLQSEILTLKRRALALKREGNLAEAKIVLQEAKVLEQRLEALKSQPTSSEPIMTDATASGRLRAPSKDLTVLRLEEVLEDNDDGVEVDEEDMKDPEMMAALKAMGFEEEETLAPLQTVVKPSPQEKRNMQDEILAIKRSALALKKQGKAAEARDELRQAKVLEQKLQRMQADLDAKGLPPSVATSGRKPLRKAQTPIPMLPLAGFVSEDEEEEVEVSADDFMDPELVAALKSVGWQEEDTFVKDQVPVKEEPAPLPKSPPGPVQPYRAIKLTPALYARKLQLQKDLLACKRKALALKREGKLEDSKVQLKQGKLLEKEMEEIENAALGLNQDHKENPALQSKQSLPGLPTVLGDESDDDEPVTDADMQDPELLNALKSFGWKPELENNAPVNDSNLTPVQLKPDTVDKLHDSRHKLVLEEPPYKKADAESVSDPIWNAIMNSSRKHYEVQDTQINGDSAVKSPEVVRSSEDTGDMGSSIDMLPPFFDHPPSVTAGTSVTSTHGEVFDLLSGGTWEPTVENAIEKGESKDDEDDVFDSGLIAALQSIGMGLPPKDSSHKQSLGRKPNGEGQRGSNLREKTASLTSRQQPENKGLSFPQTSAEAVSSAASRNVGLDKAGSFNAPGKPVMSTFADASGSWQEPTAPIVDSHVPVTAITAPTVQEEIKMHKRKALALKREGKQSEAREELRMAKTLEKQLESTMEVVPEDHQSLGSVSKSSGTFSSTSPDKVTASNPEKVPMTAQTVPGAVQTHKEQVRQELRQGKDRKKLQQESLAHKRKALGLRREGKTAEAEEEFELAKSLEKQMEELDGAGQSSKGAGLEATDFGLVEDLLDPQLMAALKGLGWNDGDLHAGGNTNKAGVSGSGPSRSNEQVKLSEAKDTGGGQASSSTAHYGKAAHPNNARPDATEGSSALAGSVPASARKVEEERISNRNNAQIQSTLVKKSTSDALSTASSNKMEAVVASSSQQLAPAREKGSSSSKAQVERKQLEDRIKQEKVKAVELKRAGRQGEALEVLRGAKRLEKQLLSMTS